MENQKDIGGGILGQGLRYRFRVQGLGHAGIHKNKVQQLPDAGPQAGTLCNSKR